MLLPKDFETLRAKDLCSYIVSINNTSYTLVNKLGSGAFGVVYSAVAPHTELRAVKLHRKGRDIEAKIAQVNEFVLHAEVSGHPNVVEFFTFSLQHDFPISILGFSDGEDLAVRLSEFDRNAGALIKTCITQILKGVRHCHGASVFHCDIKPENILCSRDLKNFRLTDFGLATHERYSTRHGHGTVQFMGPECIGKEFSFRGKAYSTVKNDIWALGIIFARLIMGRYPWTVAITEDTGFKKYLDDDMSFRSYNFADKAGPLAIHPNVLSGRRLWRRFLSEPIFEFQPGFCPNLGMAPPRAQFLP
ncbi:Serine/threonine-protein kinase PAK 3 [Stygiomarasmius scandens]|uniref:Serine/threonine-protein kinase PAK 3 n=1 Tax=Marasmiellus scandens TaxID=2682957 RepID=A0ABR1JCP1_9AGAR